MDDVVLFSECSYDDNKVIGKKAAYICELYSKGFNVPTGFVITGNLFVKFIELSNLKDRIAQILISEVDQEQKSVQIQQILLNTPFPEDLANFLYNNYMNILEHDRGKEVVVQHNQEPFVSLRVSSTSPFVEDAFFLNIKGKERLINGIKSCWASLFTAKNLPLKRFKPSVIVQKMINPIKSGSAYSVNPLTNNPNEILVTVASGLGNTVTLGQTIPSAYLVSKQDLSVKQSYLHEQKSQYVLSLQKERTEKQELGDNMKNIMDDFMIQEIAKLATKVEARVGEAQRVNFAIDKHVYITSSSQIDFNKFKQKYSEHYPFAAETPMNSNLESESDFERDIPGNGIIPDTPVEAPMDFGANNSNNNIAAQDQTFQPNQTDFGGFAPSQSAPSDLGLNINADNSGNDLDNGSNGFIGSGFSPDMQSSPETPNINNFSNESVETSTNEFSEPNSVPNSFDSYMNTNPTDQNPSFESSSNTDFESGSSDNSDFIKPNQFFEKSNAFESSDSASGFNNAQNETYNSSSEQNEQTQNHEMNDLQSGVGYDSASEASDVEPEDEYSLAIKEQSSDDVLDHYEPATSSNNLENNQNNTSIGSSINNPVGEQRMYPENNSNPNSYNKNNTQNNSNNDNPRENEPQKESRQGESLPGGSAITNFINAQGGLGGNPGYRDSDSNSDANVNANNNSANQGNNGYSEPNQAPMNNQYGTNVNNNPNVPNPNMNSYGSQPQSNPVPQQPSNVGVNMGVNYDSSPAEVSYDNAEPTVSTTSSPTKEEFMNKHMPTNSENLLSKVMFSSSMTAVTCDLAITAALRNKYKSLTGRDAPDSFNHMLTELKQRVTIPHEREVLYIKHLRNSFLNKLKELTPSEVQSCLDYTQRFLDQF